MQVLHSAYLAQVIHSAYLGQVLHSAYLTQALHSADLTQVLHSTHLKVYFIQLTLHRYFIQLTSFSHCAPAPDLSGERWGLWGGVLNVCWGVFSVCWGGLSVLPLSISAIVRSPFIGDFNKSAKQRQCCLTHTLRTSKLPAQTRSVLNEPDRGKYGIKSKVRVCKNDNSMCVCTCNVGLAVQLLN